MEISQVRALGQILDINYGTGNKSGEFRPPTMCITSKVEGDVLTCTYTTIVHLASERNLREQVRVFEDESVKLVNDFMKSVRKQFKESAGASLKAKQISTNDSIELITASPFTPRKTAYYRRFVSFKIG